MHLDPSADGWVCPRPVHRCFFRFIAAGRSVRGRAAAAAFISPPYRMSGSSVIRDLKRFSTMYNEHNYYHYPSTVGV